MTISERRTDPAGTQRAPDPARRRLTAREAEVALLVAGGLSDAAIAERLDIAKGTVVTHIQHIRFRLGLTERAAIGAWVAARRHPASRGVDDGRVEEILGADDDRPPRDDETDRRCHECGRDLRGREHLRVDRSGGAGTDAGHVFRACSWHCLSLSAWTRHFDD